MQPTLWSSTAFLARALAPFDYDANDVEISGVRANDLLIMTPHDTDPPGWSSATLISCHGLRNGTCGLIPESKA